MLEGIPKREYPKLFYRYAKEFFEVLAGKTSLKLYLVRNFPSFYKAKFREGEVLKWKGREIIFPKALYCTPEAIWILSGWYSISECKVNKNDIVFDVGAHYGFFSYFALQNGASEIYAFEPNPYTFEILKRHCEMWSNGKIRPFNVALWSSEGFSEFFIPGDSKSGKSTILKDRMELLLKDIRRFEKLKVETTTIDNFVKKNKVEKVDFIKIDTEGAEKEIIKGARETINSFRPKMIIAAEHLPNDKEEIPELILSIREDYKFKLVKIGQEEDLFFF